MKFWLSLIFEPTEQLVDHARMAEDLGFEGVALADHVVIKDGDDKTRHEGMASTIRSDLEQPDLFGCFCAMAAVTTRLRFLSHVLVAPLRDPFMLAKQAGTLAILSQDRFVLGTAVGWLREEFETVGHDFSSRGQRMDEMLPIMRDFWDDGYAEFHGEHYDFPRSGMFPVPDRQVPVWIGGSSARAARRAAEHDGYIPMRALDEQTRAEFRLIDDIRREQGLTGPFERMVASHRLALANPSDVRDLEETEGITSILIFGWPIGDRSLDLDQKRSSAARFAERMMCD